MQVMLYRRPCKRYVGALLSIVLVPWIHQCRNASALVPLSKPHPTPKDTEFNQWCDDHGIVRLGVESVTTPLSLGGRGLFAQKPLPAGSVVATIPSDLVLHSPEQDWQLNLSSQVYQEYQTGNPWIRTWPEQVDLERLLLSDRPMEEIKQLYQDLGSSKFTEEEAMSDMQERIDNFERRRRFLPRENTAKWYTLVMSRTCYLGKEWDYAVGLVPFFDMLNHSYDSKDANVQLKTVGGCLPGGDIPGLDESDLCLVITKKVERGKELLTQYETDFNDKDLLLKLWLQYGIPPPEA